MKHIVGLAFLAVLVGCASKPAPPTPTSSAPMDFSLPIWPSAQQHTFADDRGHIVVIDAWASWCAPCKTELPQLDALAKKWAPEGVRAYAVNIDTASGAVQSFLATTPLSLPILLDPGAGVLTQVLGLKSMPTTWVLDKEGRVVLTEEGSLGKVDETVNIMLGHPDKP